MKRAIFIFAILLFSATARAYDAPEPATKTLGDAIPADPDLYTKFQTSVQAMVNSDPHNAFGSAGGKLVIVDVNQLPEGKLAELTTSIAPDHSTMILTLKLTPQAKHSLPVLLEEWGNIQASSAFGRVKPAFYDPFHRAEVEANARAGSPFSKEKLERTKLVTLQSIKENIAASMVPPVPPNTIPNPPINEFVPTDPAALAKLNTYLDARIAETTTRYQPFAAAAHHAEQAANTAWSTSHAALDALDAQEHKLNELVVANDRVGVRKLVQAYLPWPLMEPSEKAMWQRWLDAIEHPDHSQSEITFRGLDDNHGLGAPPGEFAEASTVIEHNQGNYNRRLRSLATMRDKFMRNGIYSPRTSLPGAQDPVTIAQGLQNHSNNPQGSPFLSGSELTVAERFGQKKIALIRMDRRRLFPSPYSYNSENEMIAPLLLFPDEVLHMSEIRPNELSDAFFARFVAEAEAKLGRPLTDAEKNLVDAEIFRVQALKSAQETYLNDAELTSAHAAICGPGFGSIVHGH